MLPTHHAIFGAIFVLALWILFPSIGILGLSIIFLSSVLIDVDHYIYYIFKKRDWSLKNAYDHCYEEGIHWLKLSPKKRAEYKWTPLIFHGVELWLPLLILSYVHEFFLWIFLGISIHLFIDYVELIYRDDSLMSKVSQVYVYFRNKNKKEFKFN